MKQTSPNVFICPDRSFHKIANKDMVLTTNILKQMDKRMKIRQLRRKLKREEKRRKQKKEAKKTDMDFAFESETEAIPKQKKNNANCKNPKCKKRRRRRGRKSKKPKSKRSRRSKGRRRKENKVGGDYFDDTSKEEDFIDS